MILHYIFKYTWVIRTDKAGGYRFNLANPLGWMILLLIAMFVGIYDGAKSMVDTIRMVVKDTQQTGVPKPQHPQPPPPAKNVVTDTGGVR